MAFSILRRLVESQQGDLSPAAAEAVLHLQFAESDQARMGELASKSNEGTLTPSEADEYDAYIAGRRRLAFALEVEGAPGPQAPLFGGLIRDYPVRCNATAFLRTGGTVR